MSNLSTYLRLAVGAADAPAESKRIVETLPRELSYFNDKGEKASVRELLLSEKIESTNLIQTEMAATVLEGAQLAKCFRQALPIINVNSSSYDYPLGPANVYAPEVTEGAEIPTIVGEYSKRTFTVKKYGQNPRITRELINDGQYDVIQLEVQHAGTAVENKLNQIALTTLLDNAGNEYDSNGVDLTIKGVKAVAQAVGLIKADGFFPDTLIMSPQAEAMVLKDFVPSNYFGGDVALTGRVPTMMGLRAFGCGVADASASYAWEFDSDGDIGMLVLDSKRAGAIAMREDIQVEKYNDPVRDLVGCAVTARFGINYLHANAASRIEY